MTASHHHAYISLGANLELPVAQVQHAITELSLLEGVVACTASSIYVSEPQHAPNQPFFANAVALCQCAQGMTPSVFLGQLLQLEQRLGRIRTDSIKNAPRVIDLDLLLFDAHEVESSYITLPHPRMRERAFVLLPLLEVAPDLILPDGEPVRAVLDGLSYTLHNNVIYQPARP